MSITLTDTDRVEYRLTRGEPTYPSEETTERNEMTEIPVHEDRTRDIEVILPFELTYYSIEGIDTSADEVTIEGDRVDRFPEDATFDIEDSTSNDGTYTVASTSYSVSSDETTIGVDEDITDSTADGVVSNASVDFLVGDDETVESASIVSAGAGCTTVRAPLSGISLTDGDVLEIKWKLTDRNGDIEVRPPSGDTLYVAD